MTKNYPAGTILRATYDYAAGIDTCKKGFLFRANGEGGLTMLTPSPNPVNNDPGIWLSGLPEHADVLGFEVVPQVIPAPARFVVRHREFWQDRNHPNTRKTGIVTAVRVAKGDPSGRGGQFHGATNFREVNA